MITKVNWLKYIQRLAAIDKRAGAQMQAWIDEHGLTDIQAAIDYAYGLATKYGETSATLSAEMYDYMADVMDADVPAAIPADTATMSEIAKALNWARYHSPGQIPGIVGRHVRQAGADTMMQNAKRDKAQWAWVPQGDTCAFCITLASRGWQEASKTVLRGNHAEHIHQNCDCTFAIAFKPADRKKYDYIYDPDRYKQMYDESGGDINAMRRKIYDSNKDEINAHRRDTYQVRTIEYYSNEKNRQRIMNITTDDIQEGDKEVIKVLKEDFKGNIPAKLVNGSESSCDFKKEVTNSLFRIQRTVINTAILPGEDHVDIGNPVVANSIHERIHDIINQLAIKRAGVSDGWIVTRDIIQQIYSEKNRIINNAFVECFSDFDDAAEIYRVIHEEIGEVAMTPTEMLSEAAVNLLGKDNPSKRAELLYDYLIKEWNNG